MNYKSLLVLFYGILMGTANKIPGVSGGLVAIAIGFYEKLVFSLKKFDKINIKASNERISSDLNKKNNIF